MSEDIVQRLLNRIHDSHMDAERLMDEAAAEIERLRAALHNIGIGGNGERNWTLDEVRAVAWDALESCGRYETQGR